MSESVLRLAVVVYFCSLLQCFTVSGQTCTVYRHSAAPPGFPESTYEFPILEGGDEAITRKINNDLAADVLDITPGQEEVSIFEKVWRTPEQFITPISDLSFEVKHLNARVYSVLITGESCRAYCHYFRNTYNYDIQSGARISADTLFSEAGRRDVLAFLSARNRSKMTIHIAALRDSLRTGEELSVDDRDFFESAIEMFRNCMDGDIGFRGSLNYFDLSLSEGSIVLNIGPCSVHAIRALDDLGDIVVELQLEEWKSAFSSYGHKLLGLD